MMAKFTKGQAVTDVERKTRYQVETAHRDNTYTVRAIAGLNADGTEQPGRLGYVYRNIPAFCLRPLAERVDA